MKKNRRLLLRSFWALLCFASCQVVLYAQDVPQYSGPYQINGYNGTANFGYFLQAKDTVLEGPFLFDQANLEDLISKQDSSFSIRGGFKMGAADGEWQFRFGEFRSSKESRLVDYQYRVAVDGIQQEARGRLNKGKQEGEWIYSVDSIAQSEVAVSRFKSSIEFSDGIPQRSFRIQDEGHTLVGRCLRNGLAHDQWSLFPNDGSNGEENWFFDNGLLQRITYTEGGISREFQIFTDEPENGKTVSLDQTYLDLILIKKEISGPADIYNSALYALLAKNAGYYDKINGILSGLGQSGFSANFKVRVAEYPSDSTTSTKLQAIQRHYGEALGISINLVDNTQLSILTLTDEEAEFLEGTALAISTDFLEPLKRLIKYYDSGVLEYLSPAELDKALWPTGRPSAAIQVETRSGLKEFTGPGAETANFEGGIYTAAEAAAAYAFRSLDSIQEVLSKKLSFDKRQRQLVILENQLVARSDSLTVLLDSIEKTASSQAKRAIKRIRELATDNLNSYAKPDADGSKEEKARQLVACQGALYRLAEAIGALPTQREELKELYLDDIWNPFMAVIMKEEVKKRISAAYRKYLLPYALEQVSSALDCDNAGNLAELMEQLYRRMTELREEDTAKMERKLKREQDPLEILELFELKNPLQD